MGNSTNFNQIEAKYGQSGIDYVTFRYHERRSYHRIRALIDRIKQHATLEQKEALEFINQEKKKLQQDFTNAKNQAELSRKGSIAEAQTRSRQKVQEFSGFNEQLKKLQDLYATVDTGYNNLKVTVQKRIREEMMKAQNKSKIKGFKQFDDKSDNQRKNIEEQCIKKYPQKKHAPDTSQIQERINWENYKSEFQRIFNKSQVQSESQNGRKTVKSNILPHKAPVCC